MAMSERNASESLVVLVHLFIRLDLFTEHCWRTPLIHPGFREVTIFAAKSHSSFGSLLVRPGKASWITRSCSSLATTFAVSLQEFQSFQSFHFLWCQTSALHWIASAMAVPFAHACCYHRCKRKKRQSQNCFPLCPTYVWVSKTVVGKVPTLASGVALGSPPSALREDSQPLAASHGRQQRN